MFASGTEFAMQWAEYRSFLLMAGWGYAHRWEVTIAAQAVAMPRVRAIDHVASMTVCKDSRLRIAAMMRVLNQPMITIRFSVKSLNWDVVVYLPRANGAAVTDYVLNTAEGMTGSISCTYLNLMLTEAELYRDRGIEFENARRVCSWGMALLRDGVRAERDLQEAFSSESRKIGHLMKARFDGEDVVASEAAMVEGVISVQYDFDLFMDLVQGIGLN